MEIDLIYSIGSAAIVPQRRSDFPQFAKNAGDIESSPIPGEILVYPYN